MDAIRSEQEIKIESWEVKKRGSDAFAPLQLSLLIVDEEENDIKGEEKETDGSGGQEQQFLDIKDEEGGEKKSDHKLLYTLYSLTNRKGKDRMQGHSVARLDVVQQPIYISMETEYSNKTWITVFVSSWVFLLKISLHTHVLKADI